MFHFLKAGWTSKRMTVVKTIFLSDPAHVVPFPIINETTKSRYLTGADFDIESIQPVKDGFWFGDEFGPWLLHTDHHGHIKQVIAATPGDQPYYSPDNALIASAEPGKISPRINVYRSGGFEGMAISSDGRLYPMLEKPIYDAKSRRKETIEGKQVLRIFEFNPANQHWSNRIRYYPLEAGNHAIGDFNIIEGSRALIIERDGGQGDPRDGWSKKPAMFKRIYLVDLDQTDRHGVVKKIAYIDLMNIQDPNGVAPRGTKNGIFTFPFITIEDVDRVDHNTIVVANDNNYPFSVGRKEGQVDDNEFIVLNVRQFLEAK
jgi:hypothetical protein